METCHLPYVALDTLHTPSPSGLSGVIQDETEALVENLASFAHSSGCVVRDEASVGSRSAAV
jgi:hypothetical protein